MAKYRKKPVNVEAVRWDSSEESLQEIIALGSDRTVSRDEHGNLFISTLEGEMKANVGDYIIKGVSGEIYPCKPDIFTKTYIRI